MIISSMAIQPLMFEVESILNNGTSDLVFLFNQISILKQHCVPDENLTMPQSENL